uniref:V-type proton ATPase subunit C n=1 Tax=Parastrongyloides trichosuri TaxID=131310 RepID=A0A0N4Z1Z4_PARTI
MNCNEYWFISAPGDVTTQDTWEKLNLNLQGICDVFKFNIPDLKVGTLDQLIGLAEEMNSLDSSIEKITIKLVHHLGEVLEEGKDKVLENLIVDGKDIDTYICKFQWQAAKYPLKQSLKVLSEIIGKQVFQIENDMKSKMMNYNNLKTALINIDKKSTGSLVTKDLYGIVKAEDFVLNSEYLQTLCVAVPKMSKDKWEAVYVQLADKVVPKSSKLIIEEGDYSLYTVTLFKLVIDEFKKNCQENKFIVRDFIFDEEALQLGKFDREKVFQEVRKHYPPLVRWLKINYSELLSAHIHIKALRIFIESVLRYGLPVNFVAAVIKPRKGTHKRIREQLNKLYHHLDCSGSAPIDAFDEVFSLKQLGLNDYYPYVYFDINTDYFSKNNF